MLMISPTEGSRKIVCREDWSLLSIGQKTKQLKAEELPAKFRGSKIEEFCDAMDSRGIKFLVYRKAQIIFIIAVAPHVE